MISNGQQHDLVQQYDGQIAAAGTLLDLLKQEESALQKKDINQLNACVQKKESLLNRFEEESIELQNSETALSGSLPKEILNDKKQDLKNLLENIQQQNRINAGIVNVSHEFTQQMLTILRGTISQPATYDARGNSSSDSKNQSLAKV